MAAPISINDLRRMQPRDRHARCVRESGLFNLRKLPNHKQAVAMDALVEIGHAAGFLDAADDATTFTFDGIIRRFEAYQRDNLLPDQNLATVSAKLLGLFTNIEINYFGVSKGINMRKTGTPDRNKDAKVALITRTLNERCDAVLVADREAERMIEIFGEMAFGRV